MTEVSDYSKAGEAKLDATMTDNPCATILQAIVAEATEYSKKSIDDRLTFVEKLLLGGPSGLRRPPPFF